MKFRLILITVIAILASVAYARFAKFVHVAPGIEKEHPSMPYSINTTPVLKISSTNQDTFIVTIPLKETRNTSQQYWKILCTSPLKEDQLNFREYVWEYEGRKGVIQMIENHERMSREAKAEAIKKYAPKSRSDVKAIELLRLSKESKNIVLKIPKSEIGRTYIYNDYPRMVMDGGYFYCFDLPAYYKQVQAEPAEPAE